MGYISHPLERVHLKGEKRGSMKKGIMSLIERWKTGTIVWVENDEATMKTACYHLLEKLITENYHFNTLIAFVRMYLDEIKIDTRHKSLTQQKLVKQ